MTHTDTEVSEKPADWITHLEDSIRALGEAAHEWQVAHQAAQVLSRGVELDRRALYPGQVSVHRPGSAGWDATPRLREPHTTAVYDLGRLYLETGWHIRERYVDAALLYASGAAWAIAHVQSGETPSHVQLELDAAGQPIPGGYTITGLDHYAGARKLAAAHDRLAGLLDMARHTGAAAEVMALPDAAYQYGAMAEAALQFVLLGPKHKATP